MILSWQSECKYLSNPTLRASSCSGLRELNQCFPGNSSRELVSNFAFNYRHKCNNTSSIMSTTHLELCDCRVKKVKILKVRYHNSISILYHPSNKKLLPFLLPYLHDSSTSTTEIEMGAVHGALLKWVVH